MQNTFTDRPIHRHVAAAGLLLAASAALHAQGVYRSVGPDGRVTYSDKPPATAPAREAGGRGEAAAAGSALPYELRQIAARYPVTLYTGPDCVPCGAGRALLTSRGIPFTERTVSSGDDVAALQRLAGEASLPLLSIGSQQLRGFSDVEWTQYLDAAGYPKASALPGGYRAAPATPLVEAQRPAPAPTPPAAAGSDVVPTPTRPRAAPAPERNANPAGIRF